MGGSAAPHAAPLHVVERGAGAPGPLVVLVHGSMDRSAGMARVASKLSGHHVVRYDRRGYGRSRGTGPASDVDGNVDDLLGVVDERAGDGRPVVAVGHSFGGVVALAAAIRRPDRIRAVVTFEAPLPWLPWWPSSTAGARAHALREGGGGDPGDAVEGFLRRMLGDARWEAMPEATKRDRRLEGPALVADMGAIRSGEAAFDISDLPVPVVAGYGTRSGEHQARAARLLAERSGGEVVAIDGAGHGAHLSHSGPFAELVRRAVTRV